MIVFWHLLFAHLLADFVFHGNRTFDLKKNTFFYGHLLHGFVYFMCLAVCAWPFLNTIWVNTSSYSVNGWGTIALLALVHILIDKINKADIMVLDGCNAAMFLVWQMVEILILFVVFPIMPVDSPSIKQYILGEKLLLVVNGSIFVTYFVMVFIHLLSRDFFGKSYPSFDAKYLSMLYRLVFFLLFLLPSWYGYVLGISWGLGTIYYNRRKLLDDSLCRVVAGSSFAVILGVITRILIY